MNGKAKTIAVFLQESPKCVMVSVAHVQGSTPRDAGAFMLVSSRGSLRTIGGGQLEYAAIDRARQMLKSGTSHDVASVGLGPETGQCCGGRVSLQFQQVDEDISRCLIDQEETELRALPHVYIFGAGHVGNALSRAFSLLPVRAILVDNRKTELDQAPDGIETCLAAMPEELVRDAPPGSAFLILTHDHALDFLIASEALARTDSAYTGMIGSKSKRGTFSHWFRREGGDQNALKRLICPMGGAAVKDKRPEVIAALAAAEVLTALLGVTQTAAQSVKAPA